LLDRDLAELYGVETKVLKQVVKRNIKRFPDDFMFELSSKEAINLRSQFVTSSLTQWGGTRYAPMAFTEQVSFAGPEHHDTAHVFNLLNNLGSTPIFPKSIDLTFKILL
jgi:hypothetical protein